MRCNLCGSTTFRLSRLRVSDLPRMVFLQYPVRCRICYKRGFTSLLLAWRMRREDKLRHQKNHGKGSTAPGRA